MPTITLDPCETCKKRLRDILTVQGAGALKAQVVDVVKACPACHSQLPKRPDMVLVTNLPFSQDGEPLTAEEQAEATLTHERAIALANELHDRFQAEGLDAAQRMTIVVGAAVQLGVLAGYSLEAVIRGMRHNLAVYEEEL